MQIEAPALLVRIYIGEADHHDGKPLYQAIVAFLRDRGMAGATVIRGIEGVDQEDRIRAILPELDAMVGDGLITLEKIEVLAYRGSPRDA